MTRLRRTAHRVQPHRQWPGPHQLQKGALWATALRAQGSPVRTHGQYRLIGRPRAMGQLGSGSPAGHPSGGGGQQEGAGRHGGGGGGGAPPARRRARATSEARGRFEGPKQLLLLRSAAALCSSPRPHRPRERREARGGHEARPSAARAVDDKVLFFVGGRSKSLASSARFFVSFPRFHRAGVSLPASSPCVFPALFFDSKKKIDLVLILDE